MTLRQFTDEHCGFADITTVVAALTMFSMVSGGLWAFFSVQAVGAQNTTDISTLVSTVKDTNQHMWQNKSDTDKKIENILQRQSDHDQVTAERLARIESGIEYLKRK